MHAAGLGRPAIIQMSLINVRDIDANGILFAVLEVKEKYPAREDDVTKLLRAPIVSPV